MVRVLLAISLLASPSASAVETAPVASLVRDDAALADWVRTHSPAVAAADARVAESRADLGTSRLLPNPQLDVTLSDINVTRSNPPGLGFDQTAIYSGGLSQQIEVGKRGPRIRAARLRLDAGRQDYRAVLRDTVADARAALARVVYLRAKQAILDESLAGANHVLDLERTRLAHGDLSGNDFDRLTLDTLSLESDVARNRADLDDALAGCQAALFAPCDADATADGDLDRSAAVPKGIADPHAIAGTRPEIVAMRIQEQASHADATLARRKSLPDVNARVGYTHDNLTISGDQQNTLGLTLAFPLPLFDRGQHDAAHALARERELAAGARAAMAAARADLERLLARQEFLETTLNRLRSDAVDRSRGVVAATEKAFDAGQVSLTDLLLARRGDIALRLNVLDLQFDGFGVRNELRKALSLDLSAVNVKVKP